MTYRVYEVQQVVTYQQWYYDVEDSEDEALEKVQANECDDPIADKTSDPDYGLSGWSVREADKVTTCEEEQHAWWHADEDLTRNLTIAHCDT